MRRTIWTGAAIVAGGLLIAGCGSNTGASGAVAAAGDGDPCGMLTKVEMTAITSDVVTYTDSRDATCTYHSDPKDGVDVTVYRSGGAERMATARTGAKMLGGIGAAVSDKSGAGRDVGTMLNGDTSAPPALGDEALWELNDTLAVRKGEIFIEVSPPTLHDPVTHGGITPVKTEEKTRNRSHDLHQIIAKTRCVTGELSCAV